MIKIEIQLDELKVSGEKKAGRIECISRAFEPVGEEEIWLRDAIFAAIQKIGKEIGEREGAKVSMAEFPLGKRRP